MKVLILFCCFTGIFLSVTAQQDSSNATIPAANKMTVEAACGQCQFGLPGKSCDLAVRIKGTAYFVAGTSIDSHGDAHATDGFCNAVRTASVQGELVNNRFKASYFKLVGTHPVKSSAQKRGE